MTDRKSFETIQAPSLVPERVLSETSDIMELLRKYYEFVGENGRPTGIISNTKDFRKFDDGLNSYVELLRDEFGIGISGDIVASKDIVFRNLKTLYQTKGTIESFRLFFRFLFGKEIDVKLPREQILIASGGKWTQNLDFYVDLGTEQNAQNFRDELTQNSLRATCEVFIGAVKYDIRILDITATKFSDTIFKITAPLDRASLLEKATDFSYGEIQGKISGALSPFEILESGSGFQVNELISINKDDAAGAIYRVIEIDGSGGIVRLQNVSVGIGFTNDVFVAVSPSTPLDDVSVNYITSLNHKTGKFTEELTIDRSSDGGPFQEVTSIVVITPTEDIVNNETNVVKSTGNDAVIKFTPQNFVIQDGFFATNDGFLSDAIYLQDNFYYQPYSYVITSSEQLDDYKNPWFNTVHPAGFKLFAEYEVTNDFSVGTSLDILKRVFFSTPFDEIEIIDSSVFDFDKTVAGLDLVEPIDDISLDATKYFIDSIASPTQVVNLLKQTGNVYSVDYFSEEYSEGITQINIG